jgi:riboflavin synthase alpha subunit
MFTGIIQAIGQVATIEPKVWTAVFILKRLLWISLMSLWVTVLRPMVFA